jgi:hypothetical protein
MYCSIHCLLLPVAGVCFWGAKQSIELQQKEPNRFKLPKKEVACILDPMDIGLIKVSM